MSQASSKNPSSWSRPPARIPPLRAADLGKASAKTPGNVNVLLGRLTEAGALYRIRKGEYEYTAPKFRDFLLRR
jgi:hypothetical protein